MVSDPDKIGQLESVDLRSLSGKPCQLCHLQRLARVVTGRDSRTVASLVESRTGHGYDAVSGPAVDRVWIARWQGSSVSG